MARQMIRLMLMLFILAGCGQATSIKTTHSFPEEKWQRFENPVLEFDIKPGIFYDMHLELKYELSTAPKNLRMTVIMNTPSGEMRARDIILQTGIITGDNAGPARVSAVLRKEYAFAQKGVCSFEIENRSQQVVMEGMQNISIILKRSE